MTLTPTGPALSLLVVTIVLLTASWITVSMRLMLRHKLKTIGLDDWLMVAGLVFFTLACQATISGSLNGVGSSGEVLTEYYEQEGRMWFMFFQLFYVASTAPIKASICVALMRIATQRGVHYVLYFVIILSTIAAFVTDVTVLAWCRPVSATWNPSDGTCADPSVITNVSFFISACSILTDWTCAILPAYILWDVQLKYKIKVPVAIILSFGFVASAATIVRLRYLLAYNNPDNYLLGVADIAIWSITESGLGVVAGSMATLRPLLNYIPFMRSKGSSARTPISGGRIATHPQQSHRLHTLSTGFGGTGVHHTIIEAGDADWENTSDSGSQRTIVQKSTDNKGITVTIDVSQEVNSNETPKDQPKEFNRDRM